MALPSPKTQPTPKNATFLASNIDLWLLSSDSNNIG